VAHRVVFKRRASNLKVAPPRTPSPAPPPARDALAGRFRSTPGHSNARSPFGRRALGGVGGRGCPLFFNSGVASVSDAAGPPSRAPGVQSAPRGLRFSFSRERRFGQRPDRPRGLRSLRLCSRPRLPSEARRSPSRRFLPLGRRVKVPSIGRLSQERRSGTGANGRDHSENVAKLLEQGRIEPA
jgi:hypothetical protein